MHNTPSLSCLKELIGSLSLWVHLRSQTGMLNRNTAYVGTALNDPVSTSLTLFVTTRDGEQGTNNLGKRYCFLPNMCLWVIYNKSTEHENLLWFILREQIRVTYFYCKQSRCVLKKISLSFVIKINRNHVEFLLAEFLLVIPSTQTNLRTQKLKNFLYMWRPNLKIFSERNKKPDLCRYLKCFSSFEKLLNDIFTYTVATAIIKFVWRLHSGWALENKGHLWALRLLECSEPKIRL